MKNISAKSLRSQHTKWLDTWCATLPPFHRQNVLDQTHPVSCFFFIFYVSFINFFYEKHFLLLAGLIPFLLLLSLFHEPSKDSLPNEKKQTELFNYLFLHQLFALLAVPFANLHWALHFYHSTCIFSWKKMQ